jgi:hypothetical protein
VRNGSISGFEGGVDLAGEGSIVEGLRVSGPCPCDFGISANGIVRGNTVFGIGTVGAGGVGMSATGIVTGNYVSNNARGFFTGQGSTVIGNTVTNNLVFGISVDCPSNVTDNTVTTNRGGRNLELNGEGRNSTNNVAP